MKPACNTAGVTFLFKSLSVVTVLIVCSACVSPSFGEVKPNIVLVVIDALRPDHLGCYGHVRPTSPTIDELASDGVLQGFDEVVVTEKVDRDALATSTEALDIVRRAGTPFFLMVHYSDTHRPYRPPAGYVGKVRLVTDPHPYSQHL